MAKRVNESAWRAEVMQADGWRCRACGHTDRSGRSLSAHHLIFKSHCRDEYVTDRRNGVALCNWLSGKKGGGCHEKLHAVRLRLRRSQLRRESIACLEEQGLTWDETGEPAGPCSRYFEKEKA